MNYLLEDYLNTVVISGDEIAGKVSITLPIQWLEHSITAWKTRLEPLLFVVVDWGQFHYEAAG